MLAAFLQMLYQIRELNGYLGSLGAFVAAFAAGAIHGLLQIVRSEHTQGDRFMEELARGTAAKASEIDKRIEAKSEHWRLERMPVVDRNILRLAIFELTQQAVPAPVIIDEALELARRFSGDESLGFINGVLDAVHRQKLAAGGMGQ
jgi:transcription antitermination factor NusB